MLTRNSLGSRHKLAVHFSLARSRGRGELLLAVGSLLLQALLRLSRIGQLQLEALPCTNGDLSLFLRLTKALFESINLTKRGIMILLKLFKAGL